MLIKVFFSIFINSFFKKLLFFYVRGVGEKVYEQKAENYRNGRELCTWIQV